MMAPEKKRGRFYAQQFTAAQIDSCPHLKEAYIAILRLSLQHNYNGIRLALGLESVGTVKSRLSRARAALSNALEANEAL